MKWASVDSLPYLYLLMFKVCRDLAKERRYDERSFEDLDECEYKDELKHDIEYEQIEKFEIVFFLKAEDNNTFQCLHNIRLSYNIYKCFSAFPIRMRMST